MCLEMSVFVCAIMCICHFKCVCVCVLLRLYKYNLKPSVLFTFFLAAAGLNFMCIKSWHPNKESFSTVLHPKKVLNLNQRNLNAELEIMKGLGQKNNIKGEINIFTTFVYTDSLRLLLTKDKGWGFRNLVLR